MKFRKSGGKAEKIEPAMAPMIDVVFQLLVFFMLTLKIVEPEGNFNVNMPIAAQANKTDTPDDIQEYKVRITATADGSMADLRLGGESFGSGRDAFEKLRFKVLDLVGGSRKTMQDEVEIEIQADYQLKYQYVIAAVSACTGRGAKMASSGPSITPAWLAAKTTGPVAGTRSGWCTTTSYRRRMIHRATGRSGSRR